VALANVEFGLFAGECSLYDDDPFTDFFAVDPTNPDDESEYVTKVGGSRTVVTDADGHAVFGGLTYGKYCLIEVEAPAVYAKNGPMDITINHQIGDSSGIMPVPNTLKNAGFPFPITGGASSLIYVVIAGVIVGGTFYVLRKQKKTTTA